MPYRDVKKIDKESAKEKVKKILGDCEPLYKTMEELINASEELFCIHQGSLSFVAPSRPEELPEDYAILAPQYVISSTPMELLIVIDKRQIVARVSKEEEKIYPLLSFSEPMVSKHYWLGITTEREIGKYLIRISYDSDFLSCNTEPPSLKEIYEKGNYLHANEILTLLEEISDLN